MKTKELEKLLYKSFDGSLSEKEQTLLNGGLEHSEELRKLRDQIKELRDVVHKSKNDSVKPFFEERLLNKLNASSKSDKFSEWAESFVFSFRRIVFAAAIFLGFLILYNVNQGNFSAIENLFGTYQAPVEYALDPATYLLEK